MFGSCRVRCWVDICLEAAESCDGWVNIWKPGRSGAGRVIVYKPQGQMLGGQLFLSRRVRCWVDICLEAAESCDGWVNVWKPGRSGAGRVIL
jgi:hypothetical protein